MSIVISNIFMDYLSENINDILSIARWAPSVHNTQPWRVRVSKNQLEIIPERTRALVHGDPTGREAVISLGIFTEACLIALQHQGLKFSQPEYHDDTVTITIIGRQDQANPEDVAALAGRFTDRSRYKAVSVTKTDIERLEACWDAGGVSVMAVTDEAVIKRVAELTRQALLLAFSNPRFRQELTDYFVPSHKTPYGIPLSTLGTNPVKARFVKKLINSGVNRKQEADNEYKRWLSASCLVFVLADGDSRRYWLNSGRAYLRASLEIQKLGLNQATSAAIVEAADFHEDIEKLLGTDKRIQSIIRAGKGQRKKRLSGRLEPQQLLVT